MAWIRLIRLRFELARNFLLDDADNVSLTLALPFYCEIFDEHIFLIDSGFDRRGLEYLAALV